MGMGMGRGILPDPIQGQMAAVCGLAGRLALISAA